MNHPLLTTKLFIPQPRINLVSRPRLLNKLNSELQHKLTLISAPAGYGKTSILSEWIHTERKISPSFRAAWLSLDKGDNDPIRFWRYFIGALQTIEPTLGQSALGMLDSPPPDSLNLESMLTILINDIVAHTDDAEIPTSLLVLVLDDYHIIKDDSIHQSVDYLLDFLPSSMHLLIAARETPQISISRLRASGQLTEINTQELLFSLEETTLFLNTTMGLELSSTEIDTLHKRTEGWVVGLQMAALLLRGLPAENRRAFVDIFAGIERYISDYLIDEVFHAQPPDVQDFLMQTSILKRISVPLCDWVTQKDNGNAMLQYLNDGNLFLVSLDHKKHWYRYQHLFGEVLQNQLMQNHPQLKPQLHRRASEWFEKEGLIDEAIHHALASSDWQYAGNLIARHGMAMIFRSEVILVSSWLSSLPDEVILSNSRLCIIDAWARTYTSGLGDKGEQRLQQAQDAPQDDDHLNNWVKGHVAAILSVRSRHRSDSPERIRELSLQALELLSEENIQLRAAMNFNLATAYFGLNNDDSALNALDEVIRLGLLPGGDLFIALVAVYSKGQWAHLKGRLHEAAAIFQETIESVVEPREKTGMRIPVAGSLYIGLGCILLEWNQLKEAESMLQRGVALITGTNEMSRFYGMAAMARLQQAIGDPEAATITLEPYLSKPVDGTSFTAATIWLGWAKPDDSHALTDWDTFFKNVVMARTRINQFRENPNHPPSDLNDLHYELNDLVAQAQTFGWTEFEIEFSILQALTLDAIEQTEQALATLERSLILAEHGGFIRIFIDEGQKMKELLSILSQKMPSESALSIYVNTLISNFTLSFVEIKAATIEQKALIKPLSKRELEVVQCLAEGMPNKEIARNLFIANATVKQHLKNIYKKLDVHNRTQAIHQARELGLLN